MYLGNLHNKIDYNYILDLYNYHLSCLMDADGCGTSYEEGCVHAYGHLLGYNYTVEEMREGMKNGSCIYTRPAFFSQSK